MVSVDKRTLNRSLPNGCFETAPEFSEQGQIEGLDFDMARSIDGMEPRSGD
jgi:hypothetical protein